ncbi:unnamed protein product [Linum tenue]|uniref:Aminotransferase-like plant mobile domain-containing protein n=1 Tax=Linum tenue TaxID=586396 RepID=A0AAV0Q3U0_9ROSI|nr:unnamed protein product [Linum tenue]
MELDNNLLTTFVERWRRETHTFHLLEGEATITLKDIALLTDLSINGEAIIESLKKSEASWGPFILEHLGIEVPTVAEAGHKPPLDKSMLSIPWLVSHVGALGENATEEQVDRYACVYIIGLIGGVLFPNKSNRYMHCMWLLLLLGD